jgi:hypothetical protein
MDFPVRAPSELSDFLMCELESRFVSPFYLEMMGTNALGLADERRTALIAAGRTVTAGDVRSLFRVGAWRNEVMGAWFSLAVPADSIVAELIVAMSRSRGSLTAPPLAAAASIIAGQDAVPAMVDYINLMLDPRRNDGSDAIVAAGLELLGADPIVPAPNDARRVFRDLREFALGLREAFNAARTASPDSYADW